jgi:hypothetical protein
MLRLDCYETGYKNSHLWLPAYALLKFQRCGEQMVTLCTYTGRRDLPVSCSRADEYEEAAKISTERRHVIARLKKDLSASEREKAEAKGEVTRLLGEQIGQC